METYLTVNEVAVFLKLSAQTIRRYTRKKEIPYHKIFRAVRYKKSEIEQWVERETTSEQVALGESPDETVMGNVRTEGCEA